MKQRIITSVVIVAVALPILIFSQYIIFQLALGVLSLIAMYEVLGAIGLRRNLFLAIPAYIISAAAPVCAYFVNNEWQKNYILAICLTLFVYMMYSFAVVVFERGRLKFSDAATLYILLVYVSVSFSSLALLRKMGDGVVGALYIGLVFLAAWATDVFAYFTGYFFGKHKLIPEVSPKKTVEGALGGIVFAVLAFLLFGFIVELTGAYSVNYLTLAISGFVLSVISQIGDLTASALKRERGIKDYGFIFPGHGGVMDRFDSVISICTPVMVICMLFPPFN